MRDSREDHMPSIVKQEPFGRFIRPCQPTALLILVDQQEIAFELVQSDSRSETSLRERH